MARRYARKPAVDWVVLAIRHPDTHLILTYRVALDDGLTRHQLCGLDFTCEVEAQSFIREVIDRAARRPPRRPSAAGPDAG